MSYDTRAHTVCEQMLSILKTSKLNYLVKETPYSAFVTIRKRFVRDTRDLPGVTLVAEDNNTGENDFRRENLVLKQRCKSLEVEVGYLNIDIEKAKLENDTLRKENKTLRLEGEKLESNLSIANKEIDEKNLEVERLIEESDDKEIKREFLQIQLGKTKIKVDMLEKTLQEKSDEVAIRDGIVENKDVEITNLQKKLDTANLIDPTEKLVHSCDQCDFTSGSNNGLKVHVARMHAVKCSECSETFAGESKLKKHMCRQHVRNPSSMKFYMKNWYITKSCILLYNKEQEKEVAILHSDHCVKQEPCSDCPPALEFSIRVDDSGGMMNFKLISYLESGIIDWDTLEGHIEGSVCESAWVKHHDKANA